MEDVKKYIRNRSGRKKKDVEVLERGHEGNRINFGITNKIAENIGIYYNEE